MSKHFKGLNTNRPTDTYFANLDATEKYSANSAESNVMRDKTFVIRFRPAELRPQLVVAERAEVQGEHLVFMDSHGQFVALFVTEIVESWSEMDRTFEA
jgi:hypothetical protein